MDLALSALAVDASSASGRRAVTKLDACLLEAARDSPSELLLARGLLNWRLARFERAHADLQEAARTSATAAPALLALLCCSRFPDALVLCDSLGEKDVHSLVEQWRSEAEKLSNLFFPCVREPCSKPKEIFEGIRQTDMLFHAPDGTVLGLRLLLQHDNGKARVDRPLVLVFHGEDENIDTFCEEGNFEPWRAAKVNLLIADFRGYGFSSGTASHYNLSFGCPSVLQHFFFAWFLHLLTREAVCTGEAMATWFARLFRSSLAKWPGLGPVPRFLKGRSTNTKLITKTKTIDSLHE